MRIGRDYGNPGDYDTRFAGLNARMSEFHAAMALESLDCSTSRSNAAGTSPSLYRSHLDDVPGIEFQAFSPRDTSTFKDLTIRSTPIAFGLSTATASRSRCSPKVSTPASTSTRRCTASGPTGTSSTARLPVTDAVATSVLSLPVYPDLADEQVERVAE